MTLVTSASLYDAGIDIADARIFQRIANPNVLVPEQLAIHADAPPVFETDAEQIFSARERDDFCHSGSGSNVEIRITCGFDVHHFLVHCSLPSVRRGE